MDATYRDAVRVEMLRSEEESEQEEGEDKGSA